MTVAEMLARNARMYPEETALVEIRANEKIRKEINWKQFNERVDRIANALVDRGVSKGDKVIHLLTNSINWLEVFFGILRTGAWVVPLNYRFNSRDIKYCADIVEAKVMILGEEFTERIEAIRPQLTTVKDYIFVGQALPKDMEAYEDVIAKAPAKPLEVEIADEDEAGVWFTSGTTGVPKGVFLTHKNLESVAINHNVHYHIKHKDNFLIISPLYHTGSCFIWFGNLIVGARGTILIGVSPQYILETAHNERLTTTNLMVPWVQDILGALDRRELKKEDYDLSSLRTVIFGAQPVPPSLIKRWKEYFPHMKYDNNYGLSEASGPGCIYHDIDEGWDIASIGRAGFNWEARLVNDRGEDVPQGEKGEIIVKGNGVMKGYYKNPEKTAEVIKNGWLYTGDIAVMNSDGFFYIVDRKKDVVISGGENIFPVEVEEVIQSHPKVKDVAVIGIPDERLGEIAAAIIDSEPGITLTEEEVKDFCEQNLPRYKRPRRIIFDKVPRNPTGKVEKPKLRQKYAGEKAD